MCRVTARDTAAPLLYVCMMTLKQLRERVEIRPFRPIVIRTVSGARHSVNHPDYIFIPPVGGALLVVDPDGLMHHIDLTYVETVEVPPKARRSSAK
jgi:hypothetical protein